MDDLQHHILNTHLINFHFASGKLENIYSPVAFCINKAIAEVNSGNVDSYITDLMKKYHINRKMAVALSSCEDINNEVVDKIKTVYNYLGDADFFYNESLYVLVSKLPFMRTNILKLLRSETLAAEMLEVERNVGAILRFIENCKYLNIAIDLDYWDFKLTLRVNIENLGVSQNVINKAALAKLNSLAKIPNFMEHYTSLKHLNNTNCSDFIRFGIITGQVLDDTNLIRIFCNHVVKKLKLNLSMNLPTNYLVEATRMFIWVLEYRHWFDYYTRVWYPDEKRYITLNNHTFVETAIELVFGYTNINKIPNPPDKYTHPKDYFERFQTAALLEYIESKGGIEKFKWNELFDGLNNEWRWISNNLDLISEGELQHHCCGGKNYIAKCKVGQSVFFRYGGVFGYTVEVVRTISAVGAINNRSNKYTHLHVDTISKLTNIPVIHEIVGEHDVSYILNCVEGKYRRNPADATLFKIWLDLFKLGKYNVAIEGIKVQFSGMSEPTTLLEFIKSIPEDEASYNEFLIKVGLTNPSAPPVPHEVNEIFVGGGRWIPEHPPTPDQREISVGFRAYAPGSQRDYSLAASLKEIGSGQTSKTDSYGLFLGNAKQPRMLKPERRYARIYPVLSQVGVDDLITTLTYKFSSYFDPLQLPVEDYTLKDSDRNLLIRLICGRIAATNIFHHGLKDKGLAFIAAMLVNKVCFGYMSINELLSLYLATKGSCYLFGDFHNGPIHISSNRWIDSMMTYVDEIHCSKISFSGPLRPIKSCRIDILRAFGIDSLLGQELIGRKLFNDFDYYLDNMFGEYQDPKNPASKLNINDYPSWVFYVPDEKYLPKAFNDISRKTDKGEDSDNFKFTVKEGGSRHWTSFNKNHV